MDAVCKYILNQKEHHKKRTFEEEFLKEVKKQKIAWSLREESEWLEHFTGEQAAARALQQEIDKTDREIDRMVYELYGLTEEVALVEGKG